MENNKKIKVILFSIILFVLFSTVVHAEEKQVITGFIEFDNDWYSIAVPPELKPSWDELSEVLETKLGVYLDGSDIPTYIDIEWYCVDDDYENSDYYFYMFSPRWDESKYILSDSIDRYEDCPLVRLYLDESALSTLSVENSANTREEDVYNYLRDRLGLNTAASCGIMASIYKESRFIPMIVQNSYINSSDSHWQQYNSETYTKAVDEGTYRFEEYTTARESFAYDGTGRYEGAGYGLCQWTYYSRKLGLYDLAKGQNKSIGDLYVQLDYLMSELKNISVSSEDRTKVYDKLKTIPNTAEGADEAARLFYNSCMMLGYATHTGSDSRAYLARVDFWNEYKDDTEFTLTAYTDKDINSISCASPVTFTLVPRNGSGEPGSKVSFTDGQGVTDENHARYKYYVKSIMRKVDGLYTLEVNPTYFKYFDSNKFQYSFMSSGEYRISFQVMDFGSSPISFATATVYLNINDNYYPSLESIAETVMSECEGKTDYEKALYAHDWILRNARYDYKSNVVERDGIVLIDNTAGGSGGVGLWSGETGVMRQGIGTCESYHRTFSLLLDKVGIQTYRVENGGHVWTVANLDGKWTQIDSTWNDDDPVSGCEYLKHLYFGITDEMFNTSHGTHKTYDNNRNECDNYAELCTSLDNNYFVKSGEIRTWTDTIKSKILEKIGDGELSFSINIDDLFGHKIYHSVYTIIYEIAEWYLNNIDTELGDYTIGEDVYVTYEYEIDSQNKVTNRVIKVEFNHIHKYSDNVVKAATCDEDGELNRVCSNTDGKCTEIQICEVIPKLGHNYIVLSEPTCTENGIKRCNREGCNSQDENIEATGHDYERREGKKRTCTEEGYSDYLECIVCHYVDGKTVIEVTGHDWEDIAGVRATCQKNGFSAYKLCRKCSTEEGKLVFEKTDHNGNPCEYCGFSTKITIPCIENYEWEHVVWIDGIKIPAVYDGFSLTVDIGTDTTAKVLTVYDYKGSNGAPNNMWVYTLRYDGNKYTYKEETSLKNILGYHGFSIRVVGNAGLRYKSSIDKSIKNRLITSDVEGFTLVEYGTLLMKNSDYINGGELTLEGGAAAKKGRAYFIENGITTNLVFEQKDGRDRFTSVLVGIPESGYRQNVWFRAYIILQKDGVNYTIYSAPVERNVYSVAKQVLAGGEFREGTSSYNYVKSIVDAVEGNNNGV